MSYAEKRSEIKSGDLILLTHKSWRTFYDWLVQAVRIGTQSEFAHVGIVWEVGSRLFVIESVSPLIRIVPLSKFADEGFYHIAMHQDMSEAELEFALSKVGKAEYSRWQAVMGQLRKLKIGEDDIYQCAEFTIVCRSLSGVNLGDKATPSAVAEAALTMGKSLQLIKN